MNDLQIKKNLLSCPGETIREHIDEIGMSQAELAERLGKARNKLNEIIKGKTPITFETAKNLEMVLGVPANFWLNLERQYQDELNEIKKLEQLENYKKWIKKFPVKLLQKLNIIPKSSNTKQQIEHLLKFFRIATPDEWEKIYNDTSVAFKISLKSSRKTEAISVWLRLGELQANNIEVREYEKKKLKDNLNVFKKISYDPAPDWMQQLQNVCADLGIALVYTPQIKKAPVIGATRWIRNYQVPLIQMTDRHKTYNSFWFGFFHELSHIILHGKKDVFLEGVENLEKDSAKEEEANKYAEKLLLGNQLSNDLKYYDNPNLNMIQKLSKKHLIHESIIISQLQRQNEILYKNSKLNQIKNGIKVELKENNLEILKDQINF